MLPVLFVLILVLFLMSRIIFATVAALGVVDEVEDLDGREE